MSWIVSLPCTRAEAEALSGEIPALDALADHLESHLDIEQLLAIARSRQSSNSAA